MDYQERSCALVWFLLFSLDLINAFFVLRILLLSFHSMIITIPFRIIINFFGPFAFFFLLIPLERTFFCRHINILMDCDCRSQKQKALPVVLNRRVIVNLASLLLKSADTHLKHRFTTRLQHTVKRHPGCRSSPLLSFPWRFAHNSDATPTLQGMILAREWFALFTNKQQQLKYFTSSPQCDLLVPIPN